MNDELMTMTSCPQIRPTRRATFPNTSPSSKLVTKSVSKDPRANLPTHLHSLVPSA